MTIDTEVSQARFTNIVDGIPVSCDFPCNSVLHVVVRYGDETVAVLGTHYSVTLAPPDYDGFTVTPMTGFATLTGGVISVAREVPLVQDFELLTRGEIGSSALVRALDYLTMITQQLNEYLKRTLAFPAADPVSARGQLPAAADRAGKFLAFDMLGRPVAATGSTSVGTPTTAFGLSWYALASRALARLFLGWTWINITDYGGSPDIDDNTTALLTAYAAAVAAHRALYIPGGHYKFSQPVVIPPASNVDIRGDGSSTTVFDYTGVSTTANCFTFGDGVSEVDNWNINGITFRSSTLMTGGVGVLFKRLGFAALADFIVDGQLGTGKFYNGIRFDGLQVVSWVSFDVLAQNEAVQVNGLIGANPKSDFWISNYKIIGGIGLHIGGAMGGVSLNSGSILGMTSHAALFDTTLVAEINREIFVAPGATCESPGGGDAIRIDQALPGRAFFDLRGWTSSAFSGIHIVNANGAYIDHTGYSYNNAQYGMLIDDANAYVFNNGRFANNIGDAIHCSVTTTRVTFGNCQFQNNGGRIYQTGNVFASALPLPYIKADTDAPFRVQRFTGTTDGAGNVAIAHGLGGISPYVIGCVVMSKGPSGEAVALGGVAVDGTNISATGGGVTKAVTACLMTSTTVNPGW